MAGRIDPKHTSAVQDIQTNTPPENAENVQKSSDPKLQHEPVHENHTLQQAAQQQAQDKISLQNLSGELRQRELNSQFSTPLKPGNAKPASKTPTAARYDRLDELDRKMMKQGQHIQNLQKQLDKMEKSAKKGTHVKSTPQYRHLQKALDDALLALGKMRMEFDDLGGQEYERMKKAIYDMGMQSARTIR